MDSEQPRRSSTFAGLHLASELEQPATDKSTARMFDRIIDAIAATGSAITASSKYTDSVAAEQRRQGDEIAELRAQLLALSNRIEATNRVVASRTDHLA